MADNSTPTNDLTGDWQAIPLTGPPYPADRIPPDEYFGYRPGTFYSQPLWKQGLDYASVPVREIWGGLRGTAQSIYDVGHAIAYPRPPQFYAAPDSANLLQDPYLQHQATQAILGLGMLGSDVEGIPSFPAFHGSPFHFPPVAEAEAGPYGIRAAPYGVFDPTKMGTGEGTQYEGWGFYGGAAIGTGEYYEHLQPNLANRLYLDGNLVDSDALAKRISPLSRADRSHGDFGHVASVQDTALNAILENGGLHYSASDALRSAADYTEYESLNPNDFNSMIAQFENTLPADSPERMYPGGPVDSSKYRDYLSKMAATDRAAADWIGLNSDRINDGSNIVRLNGKYVNPSEAANRVMPLSSGNWSDLPFGHVANPKDIALDLYWVHGGDIDDVNNSLDSQIDELQDKKQGDASGYLKRLYPDWDSFEPERQQNILQRYGNYLDKHINAIKSAKDWLNNNKDSLTFGDPKPPVDPSLYQIWIHPGHDDMLLTNREWNLQPPKVQEAIRKNLPDLAKEMDNRYTTDPKRIYGKDLYNQLVTMTGSPKAASEALDKAGVPALRFRDRNSRYVWTDVPTLDGKRLDEMSRANPDWAKFADVTQKMKTQPQQIRLSDLNTRLNDLSNTLRGGSDQDRVLRDWVHNNWHRLSLGDHPESTYNYVIFHPRNMSIIDRNGERYGLGRVDRNPFTGEPWTYK